MISIHEILNITHILEDITQYTLQLNFNPNQPLSYSNRLFRSLAQFYAQPELHHRQGKYHSFLASQLINSANNYKKHSKPPTSQNYFDILSNIMTTEDPPATLLRSSRDTNDEGACSQTTQATDDNHPPPMTWKIDSTISDLSSDMFSHINSQKRDAANLSDGAQTSQPIMYEQPQPTINNSPKINQRIRFNLIRHKGAISDIPTLKLFKSFTQTIRNADPSVIFLPFQASKQHYSSISTLKQINLINEQKMTQFFKSYHQCQHFSLSVFSTFLQLSH
jgi:hypothetical protein